MSAFERVHNVILPGRDGTTQIDHVVVSIYGLFVIETKNMDGWIFGSAEQRTWRQQFFKKKFKFQNPLRQNSALRAKGRINRKSIRAFSVAG